MTSELVQNERTLARAPSILHKKQAVSAKAIHSLEKDGWWRSMSAALALLHHMQKLVEQAENRIAAQTQRIAHLENLSTTDDLTGLLNRRGFFKAFQAELDRTDRGLSPGGMLVLIDLDNFKSINERFGSMAGDSALRLVAKNLQNQVRAMDAAGRLGGDAFVLMLSAAQRGDAAKRAHVMGWQLNNMSLGWHGEEIPLHVSLGLKSYGPGDTANQILSAADSTLYANKQSKRGHKTT